MIQKEFCQDCRQKHNCREVFRQSGHITGPPITRKVIVAFLLPLLIFIVSLAIFDKFLSAASVELVPPLAKMQGLQTIISFLMALLITSVFVFMTRVITRRLHRIF